MPCDSAEMPLVCAGVEDLPDLLDHVLELGVRGEVVRADPDARVGPEVPQPQRELMLAVIERPDWAREQLASLSSTS